MARSIRIQAAGAFYHVMARGNRREDIFHDDDDRRFFLHTLSQACDMTGWRVHAWVLMSNHYHLFIETPGERGQRENGVRVQLLDRMDASQARD
jgi:putative transposase